LSIAEFASRPFLLAAEQALKKVNMSRPTFSLTKQLVVASALVFGASGVALGNDTGMNPVIGDSHAYFHACHVEITEVLVERLEGQRRTLRPGA
jgi:hypothetical protein